MAYSYDPTRNDGNPGAVLKAIEIRKTRSGMILSIALIAWSIPAMASEDDKNAGTCAGYLALLKKSDASVNMALEMADNPRRALNLAKEWIRQAQRAGASMGVALEGDRACKSVGIRAVDMR